MHAYVQYNRLFWTKTLMFLLKKVCIYSATFSFSESDKSLDQGFRCCELLDLISSGMHICTILPSICMNHCTTIVEVRLFGFPRRLLGA